MQPPPYEQSHFPLGHLPQAGVQQTGHLQCTYPPTSHYNYQPQQYQPLQLHQPQPVGPPQMTGLIQQVIITLLVYSKETKKNKNNSC